MVRFFGSRYPYRVAGEKSEHLSLVSTGRSFLTNLRRNQYRALIFAVLEVDDQTWFFLKMATEFCAN